LTNDGGDDVDFNSSDDENCRYKQDKSHLETELDSLKERHQQTSEEFSSANEDRVRLLEKVDEMKQQLHKLQVERDTVQRNSTKQVLRLSGYALHSSDSGIYCDGRRHPIPFALLLRYIPSGMTYHLSYALC